MPRKYGKSVGLNFIAITMIKNSEIEEKAGRRFILHNREIKIPANLTVRKALIIKLNT
jgi:hypothetical protein